MEKSSVQSINSSGTIFTDLTWQTEFADAWDMHDTGSNTERINIPISGRYFVLATASWEANATGTRELALGEIGKLNKNFNYNLISSSGSTLQTRQSVSAVLYLTKGVYVKAIARQDSGGALNVETNTTISQFMVIRIG